MGFRPSSYWRLIWQRSLLISLLAVSPVALSSEEPGQAEDEDVSAADTTQQQEQGLLPINELRTFADVFDRIKQAYVEEVDDKTLLENAIQGMLTELDPHSAYLKPEAYQDLQINTTGEFGGLGIEVGMEDGFVKVITPIDDTPAKKAGVEAGDLIIKLDSTPVKGLSLGEAVKLMRGKPGSDIVLTIIRAGIDKPLEITVTRAVIQVQSVRGRLLQKDYGYVRLSQFQINTGADMLKLLEKLRKENDADL
ncbi:MAG TPA: peptidase S41, partial [Gammaproteobacteria bacterium]|nr:peptidase S41 [Gammaproteobacteria bacterium]